MADAIIIVIVAVVIVVIFWSIMVALSIDYGDTCIITGEHCGKEIDCSSCDEYKNSEYYKE